MILPLTRGGIIAGLTRVFIPTAGKIVIPKPLGGSDSIMIGRVLWQAFNCDCPVATIMLLLLIVPILWFHKHQIKEMKGRNEQLAPNTLAMASRDCVNWVHLSVRIDTDPDELLFNSSKRLRVWAGGFTAGKGMLFHDSAIIGAVGLSLTIVAASATAAVVLGAAPLQSGCFQRAFHGNSEINA